MPIYEYECKDCHRVFDELRKADDRERPIACPDCGGQGRVLISGFAQSSSRRSGGSCPSGST